MRFDSFRRLLAAMARPSSHGFRGPQRRPTSKFHPHLESLEARVVLEAVRWINPGGGSWNDARSWDAGRVPGSDDDAIIDLAGVRVTHTSGTDQVHSLTLTGATLDFSGGILQNTPSIQGTGTFTFSGGTLSNDTVAAGTTIQATGYLPGGTLDGVTLNGDLDMTQRNGAAVYVSNGLTVNGTVMLGKDDGSSAANVYFTNTQTIDGQGSFQMLGRSGVVANHLYAQSGTVTLGPDLTIHAPSGNIGQANARGAFVNQGTLAVDQGGTLFLDGPWSNSGTILMDGGTLYLGGTFALEPGTTWMRTGGTVNLTGTLDNAGAAVVLDEAGPINFSGTIKNATLTETGGTALVVTRYQSPTLDGVTLNGDLDLATNGGLLHVRTGLTLNGTAAVSQDDGSTFGTISFDTGLTVAGRAIFRTGNYGDLNVGALDTVIFGPRVTVEGRAGSIGAGASGTFINQGTIADDLGGTFSVGFGRGGYNAGTLRTSAGSTLSIAGNTWSNRGKIRVTDATINLGGSFTTAGLGRLRRRNSTVNLTGALDNTGSTLSLGGPFRLQGSITGGTVLGAELIPGTGSLQGEVTVVGDLNNGSALYIGYIGTSSVVVTGTYTQTGVLVIQQSCTLSVLGGFANFADGTLSGGLYDIVGTFRFPGAAITADAADLTLVGSNSQITDENGADALASLAVIAPGGSLTLRGGRNLSTAGDLTNSGSLAIAQGTVNVNGTFTQTDGRTTLDGGTLTAQFVDLQGGILAGSGTINADVNNAAEIDVGTPGAAGLLTVNGNFTQTPDGVLSLKLGSFDDGPYDQLVVSGTATLDGTLNVTLLDSFVARAGDAYRVLCAGAVTGGFATVNLPDLGDGFFFNPIPDDTGLTLQTTAG